MRSRACCAGWCKGEVPTAEAVGTSAPLLCRHIAQGCVGQVRVGPAKLYAGWVSAAEITNDRCGLIGIIEHGTMRTGPNALQAGLAPAPRGINDWNPQRVVLSERKVGTRLHTGWPGTLAAESRLANPVDAILPYPHAGLSRVDDAACVHHGAGDLAKAAGCADFRVDDHPLHLAFTLVRESSAAATS